jgi:glycopeptide antibiotics resistance protein
MKKRLISAFILIAYSAFLSDLLVFKNVLLKIGLLRFKFSSGIGQANFLPFKTILPYLRGEHGWLIAIINLGGNIALFVPIGFLVPFVYRKMTWQKSLALAVAVGLAIEVMQVVFRVGIFDIDDVILNGLGVMTGYWVFTILVKWRQPRFKALLEF